MGMLVKVRRGRNVKRCVQAACPGRPVLVMLSLELPSMRPPTNKCNEKGQ